LPAGVFGPRDFAPFRRLASARALLIVTAARGAAPVLGMAGFLRLAGCTATAAPVGAWRQGTSV
jgi:hypothetical protein